MWTCPNCGERIEDQFDSCWKCAGLAAKPGMAILVREKRVTFRMFRGTFKTWDELFTEASNFANGLGPGQLINISHSVDDGDGVVAVWFWSDGTEEL